ncbi:Ig-like domain-containing protein [Candidatus Soleaferrea massiliensis]|uniref:Ig-like domain-containing protein n=1 Tax=Candidatus Soleaferrea massiliensis TaxID=1470354 RepID=UPI00058D80E9|nr:Ig-like domain-containing protein [Candidatus Soleaferrea massiliensis]
MKHRYRVGVLTLVLSILLATSVGAWDLFSVPAAVPQTQRTAAVSFQQGKTYAFSAEDMEKKLQLPAGELQGITITALPDEKDGVLYCRDRKVQNYEQLSRGDIDELTFVSTGDAGNCTFSFIPKISENVRATISMLVSTGVNTPPRVENASFSTLSATALRGRVSAFDAENDALQIRLSQKPQKGEIKFDGLSFTYTPFYGMSGKDTFQFYAVDAAGNDSEEAVMQIDIEEQNKTCTYADMSDNTYAYAASKLLEHGLVQGEQIGSIRLFRPADQVKRYEYVLMLLGVTGREKNLPACVNTGLANDGEIAPYLKPYVKKAVEEGIITESSFAADEVITRAEAVVLTNRAAAIKKVSGYNLNYDDTGDIPEWALQSYIDLCAYRMIDLPDNLARPNAALTRDFSADLLWQLKKYHDKVR